MNFCSSPFSSRALSARFPLILGFGFCCLFAVVFALGLGASSALAQGTYYPDNGIPITSSPELALIEAKLNLSNRSLILPPPAGKTTASAAEYTAAVQAVANDVAAAGSIPSAGDTVTIATLTRVVANYTNSGNTVSAALNSLGLGIIASGNAVPSNLNTAAFEAANSNLGVVSVGKLSGLFQSAANNNTTLSQVGAMLQNALDGAVAANPTTLSATATAANNIGNINIITDAMNSIINSTASNAATSSLKQDRFVELATGVGASTAVSGSGGNASANLDAAATQLTSNTTIVVATVTNNPVIQALASSVSSSNWGTIAQGVLRNTAYRTANGYTALTNALGANAYANTFIAEFQNIGGAYSTTTINTRVATGADPAAIAAASTVKFPSFTAQVENDVLRATAQYPGNGLSNTPQYNSAAVQKIISKIAGAYIAVDTSVVRYAIVSNANLSLADYAKAEDVVAGAIVGAPIKDAGALVKSGLQYAGQRTGTGSTTNPGGSVTSAGAAAIASSAIAAAASVSPVSNIQNAYADISYNVGSQYKGPGAADTYAQAVVTALVSGIVTANSNNAVTAPTYIGVVGALAGNLKQNFASILAAGKAAASGDDDDATQAGANLYNTLPGTNYGNYQQTIAALAAAYTGSGTLDARNLALLYASSLFNPADASATLAAAIATATGSTPGGVTALTNAAISANRSLQPNLTVASTVAVHVRSNSGDIQVYIGRQILDNPSYIGDITTAATVILPQFSHVIGATLGFNAPTTASTYVPTIFVHSQIIIPGTLQSEKTGGTVDSKGAGGRPAAVAAISAGLTTGIVKNTQLSTTDTKNALSAMIRQVVLYASNASYNDQGIVVPTGTPAGSPVFRQSDGGVGTFTATRATGTAGAITGFVAQLVKPNDTTTGGPGSPLYDALTAAANQAGSTYIYAVAQAAGQAFGWVSGKVLASAGTAPAEIAAAIAAGVSGSVLASVQNAVNFGFNEAAGGDIVGNPARRPGAGALGLTNTASVYYQHSSAQGTPTSNIFTL